MYARQKICDYIWRGCVCSCISTYMKHSLFAALPLMQYITFPLSTITEANNVCVQVTVPIGAVGCDKQNQIILECSNPVAVIDVTFIHECQISFYSIFQQAILAIILWLAHHNRQRREWEGLLFLCYNNPILIQTSISYSPRKSSSS